MRPFKSVTIVKYPLDLVWITIRDRLSELAPFMDDIEKVICLEREEQPDGTIRLVNLWQVNPKLPALRVADLSPEALAWIDRAEWQVHNYECSWRIESHLLPEHIQCLGRTRYEPAIGGRGTRITFEGQLEMTTHNLAGVPFFLDGTLLKGIELLATTLIPKNLRKLTEAVSVFLDKTRAS